MREHCKHLGDEISSLKSEILEIFTNKYGISYKVEKILNGRDSIISAKAFYAARNSVLDSKMSQLAVLTDKFVHCKRIIKRMGRL